MIEWDKKYSACLEERNRYRTEVLTLEAQLSYAHETIKRLVELAETSGHDKANVVRVARRFLAGRLPVGWEVQL